MKVISQNLWNINPPLDERLAAFISLCKRYAPDVLLLQENSFSDLLKTDVASVVRSELGMNYRSTFHAGTWRGRDEGLAVITRQEHVVDLYVPLSEGEDGMGRCLACVKLVCASRPVRFATTHLAHYPSDNASRLRQAHQICDALRHLMSTGESSLVLGGDFNCSPCEEPAQILRNGIVPLVDPFGADESAENWTFRADNPYAVPELGLNRRIDYLLFSKTVTCLKSEVLTPEKTGLRPWSDHSAIFIEIETDGCVN